MERANIFFSERAHLSEEAIALYVEALKINKTYELPSIILGHVADCKECKVEIMESFSNLEETQLDIQGLPPYFDEHFKGRKERIAITYRIAVLTVIVIGIGFVFYYSQPNLREPNYLRSTRDRSNLALKESNKQGTWDSTSDERQGILADNFKPSSNLEDLVNAESRSRSVEVISPSIGQVVGKKILFQWKATNEGSLTLKIMSNQEKLVDALLLTESHYQFSGKLPPGLYYWKLENKAEVLYLGKFIVK